MSRGVICCRQPQIVLKSKSELLLLKKKTKNTTKEKTYLEVKKKKKQLAEVISLKHIIYDATVLEGIMIYGEEIAEDFVAYPLQACSHCKKDTT